MNPSTPWIWPRWPAPKNVRALITTRQGGVSLGPYASMNLGTAVNDEPATVDANRALLRSHLPSDPCWLRQVHGTRVVDAAQWHGGIEADGCVTRGTNVVCAVMSADCIPVLLCDIDGRAVAAAHAGWRGLSAGILESAVRAMGVSPASLHAYLGPAIGPRAFEVGNDVHETFTARDPRAASAFQGIGRGKWLCDLFQLARQRLTDLGVRSIHGGEHCTYSNPELFYSHRRDKVTGRMAALIWISA
ncbi:MAG: peptidoglycan editing factor PgeF [Betaproteobacteria bacterium]|nr:peptidoglycan editing factor PgeF [Betaproteobacteria bacterium]